MFWSVKIIRTNRIRTDRVSYKSRDTCIGKNVNFRQKCLFGEKYEFGGKSLNPKKKLKIQMIIYLFTNVFSLQNSPTE